MGPAFVSPDIASIVDAYPPDLPSRGSSAVVRSLSGTRLFDSRKILKEFAGLLDNHEERIPISQLGLFLGIKDVDWILGCSDRQTIFSRDGKVIIPSTLVEEIWKAFVTATDTRFLDQEVESIRYDISEESIGYLVDLTVGDGEDGTLQTLSLNGRTFWYQPELLDGVIQDMKKALGATGSERCDLSEIFHEIEPDVLLWILKGQIEQGIVEGKAATENTHTIYYPVGYDAAAQSQEKEEQTRRINEAVDTLADRGWVKLHFARSGDSTVNGVLDRHVIDSGNEPAVVTPLDDHSVLIMKEDVVASATADLLSKVKDHVMKLWCAGRVLSSSSVANLLDDPVLLARIDEDSLSRVLLRTAHRKRLQRAVEAVLDELVAASRRHFANFLHQRITGPAQLYTNGVESVEDPALKERLDGYVAEIVRTDILPLGIQQVRDANLFEHHKDSLKDFDKLAVALSACRTCSDITAAITKYTRKQKLEPPSKQTLHSIKTQIVQQKLHSMLKMKRGSDILQNTIWILLSKAMEERGKEALFVSSGKDVTRMVRLYRALGGDEGSGRRLEEWRDRLKAGQESREDLEASRELARSAVEGMRAGGDGEARQEGKEDLEAEREIARSAVEDMRACGDGESSGKARQESKEDLEDSRSAVEETSAGGNRESSAK